MQQKKCKSLVSSAFEITEFLENAASANINASYHGNPPLKGGEVPLLETIEFQDNPSLSIGLNSYHQFSSFLILDFLFFFNFLNIHNIGPETA